METSSILLVALLALYMMPTALALECYECTNMPGYPGVSKCDDKEMSSITCHALMDRCMTLEGTITVPNVGPVNFQLKNCSSSSLCRPDSLYNMCNFLNSTAGIMSKCDIDCCEGDKCNSALRISGVVASLVAVLLPLVLN